MEFFKADCRVVERSFRKPRWLTQKHLTEDSIEENTMNSAMYFHKCPSPASWRDDYITNYWTRGKIRVIQLRLYSMCRGILNMKFCWPKADAGQIVVSLSLGPVRTSEKRLSRHSVGSQHYYWWCTVISLTLVVLEKCCKLHPYQNSCEFRQSELWELCRELTLDITWPENIGPY